MIPITAEQVLFIHSRLIEETGGLHGVRDLGLLQSATARPHATFDNEDLYPGFVKKAAALLESLLQNHPFVDGNKRTGITVAGIFLRTNSYHLSATNEELENFTFHVVLNHPSLEEISLSV